MNQLKRFAVMDNNTVIHVVYPGDSEELYARYTAGIASGYGVLELLNNNLVLLGGRVVHGELVLESEEQNPNIVDDDVLQYAFYSRDSGTIFAVFVTALSNPVAESYRSAYKYSALSIMDITEYEEIISIGDSLINGSFVSPHSSQES
jgi:hypothetical protein